jgi:hypothetical protein
MKKIEYPAGKMNFDLETKVVSADPRRGKLIYEGVTLTRTTKKRFYDGCLMKKQIWKRQSGSTTVSRNKRR